MKYLFILLLGLGFSQTELTTRVYELPFSISSEGTQVVNIESITGYELDYAIVRMVKFISLQFTNLT